VGDQLVVGVIAPWLGRDLGWLTSIDARLHVIDGREDGSARDSLLGDADVLLVGYPVPRVLAAKAPRLRWVHHTQAGASNLHASDLWSSDVLLTSSRGHVATVAIAEYVLAGAFHFARGMYEATAGGEARGFGENRAADHLRVLHGATMGVIGLGGIGREVGRLARAVGMRVVAIRRSAVATQRNVDGVTLLLPPDRLLELVAQSDVIAVCAQLTEETRGMVDHSVFDVMQRHAILINVARGEIVDEEAMVLAIREGRLRGAVLDVYDGELDGCPPRPELSELPQIVLTPHISGRGDPGGAESARALFTENMRRFLAGRTMINVIDRRRGY